MLRRLLLPLVSLGLATGLAQAKTKPTLPSTPTARFPENTAPARPSRNASRRPAAGSSTASPPRMRAACSGVCDWRARTQGRCGRRPRKNLVAGARVLNLFAPHGVDVKDRSLPIKWSDNTFILFDWGYYAFVYDANKLGRPPKRLRELVDNPNGPKVVCRIPAPARRPRPALGCRRSMATRPARPGASSGPASSPSPRAGRRPTACS